MARPGGAGCHVRTEIAHARRDVDPSTSSSKDTLSRDVLERHEVTVTDARPAADQLVLDDDGFVLLARPTGFTDFLDADRARDVYLPEVAELVAELSGAAHVVVLEQVVRGPRGMAAEHPGYGRQILGWAQKAHLDADEATYRTWAAHLAHPDVAARCEAGDLAVYNVWRPLVPVEQKPLGLCHARTVRPDDLVPAHFDGRYPGMPESEWYPPITYAHLAHHPDQRWYYFSAMQPDEVVVFKQWDTDAGRARCVPHCAFDDPTSRPDAVPRASIEVRVVALR